MCFDDETDNYTRRTAFLKFIVLLRSRMPR